MSNEYEVLSPWAEADPIPLKGITPRSGDLTNKTIGLFCSRFKPASTPILKVVENRLKEKFPSSRFSWFNFDHNEDLMKTVYAVSFEEWINGVDAVVAAVGD
jgi:hypothetical protein